MQLITTDELKRRLDAGEKVNLLDVREPHENQEFNIGGWLIPLGNVRALQLDELEAVKEQEIIVYCRSGNRSGQACLVLEGAGFSDVKNLAGGMLEWQEKYKK